MTDSVAFRVAVLGAVILFCVTFWAGVVAGIYVVL